MERIERERMAGYERPRPQTAPRSQQQQRPPVPPPQQRSPAASSQAADALGQVLLKKVHEKVQEDTKQLRNLVDTVSLRLGAMENTVKSVEHAVAALREEFSGIAQVAGGSGAKKTDDVEATVHKLEKSFTEFSTRLGAEVQEAERRQGAMRQELLQAAATDNGARELAHAAYARSIVVPCRVVVAEGITLDAMDDSDERLTVPAEALLPLRYPMSEKDGNVTMVYTHVSGAGDVREFAVPVQRSGIMTVEFPSNELLVPHAASATAS
jgi:hypothetical protein